MKALKKGWVWWRKLTPYQFAVIMGLAFIEITILAIYIWGTP